MLPYKYQKIKGFCHGILTKKIHCDKLKIVIIILEFWFYENT